jgi:hypothetical protein
VRTLDNGFGLDKCRNAGGLQAGGQIATGCDAGSFGSGVGRLARAGRELEIARLYFVSVGRWKRQREDRTPYGTVARAYGATVSFDDGSGDREPNSNAIRLCRNKRREQPP